MPILLSALILSSLMSPTPLTVGDAVPEFSIRTLNKEKVTLAPLLKRGPVVLIILRGYPGYQCPFCTKQVGGLIADSREITKRKASLVLVYPGPADHLDKYAGEFISGKDIPHSYKFCIDPDYSLTTKLGLRWDQPHETAYPSTFVIAKSGTVTFAKIGHSHEDRPPVSDVLAALDKL